VTTTRLERDALGEVVLPVGALYGVHTARAVQNLSFSGRTLGQYAGYLRALALVPRRDRGTALVLPHGGYLRPDVAAHAPGPHAP